jgi:superfamily II DNA or RNA helicase
MIAYIDNKYIHLDQVTSGIEEALVNHFKVKHPKSYYLNTSSDWDGWYRKYNVKHQRISRGLLAELKICCEKNNIPLEIEDARDAPEYPAPQESQITETFINGITLMDHQVRGLKVACHEECGLFNVTTGGGKTELMCGLIKMFRCPTIVITEQLIVLQQIVERLALREVVHNDDIAMFCHGHMPSNNLVMVGSIQSINTPSKPKKSKLTTNQVIKKGIALAKKGELPDYFPEKLRKALLVHPDGVKEFTGKYLQSLTIYANKLNEDRAKLAYKSRLKNAKKLQGMSKKCDLLLVDECDRASASNYKNLFDFHFKGRRKFGFSGTPFDKAKPVENLVLKERLGNVIMTAGRKELEKIGQIIPIHYIMFAFGEDGDRHDPTAFDVAEKEIIIENPEFHKFIRLITNKFPNDQTLILIDTSEIETLGKTLEEVIPGSVFIYGKTRKKRRTEVLKAFEDKELKVLIGGKILKRGLDLDGGVDNLIIIGGGNLESDFDQKIGRSVRKNERGFARVFDFLFLNNKYLYKHSRTKLKAVVSFGYKTKVIIQGKELDGAKFVKSQFRVTKKSQK